MLEALLKRLVFRYLGMGTSLNQTMKGIEIIFSIFDVSINNPFILSDLRIARTTFHAKFKHLF